MVVKEVVVKDYLSKSKLGEYTINPYVGCPHACKYCYASFMKRFTNHSEPWGEFVDVKLCDKPIALDKIAGKTVFMSSVTDCYNPLEAKYKITRKILEQLKNSTAFVQINTKNKLILRDLELLKQIKHLTVGMSVNTLNEKFSRDMDRASTISDRLETLKTLHENGIYTILFMSPIFIGITDWKAIIEKTKDFIDEYWFEDLNLRGSYKFAIMNYIKGHYSALYPIYDETYNKGNRAKLNELNHAIKEFCEEQNIKFSDCFHHEEMMDRRAKGLKNDMFPEQLKFI